MNKAKVGVVGYGTIGKRVADAVMLQSDMELMGVTANSYNYKIKAAHKKGIRVFPMKPYGESDHLSYGISSIAGTANDLINQCDVIVDCTPKGVGAENREWYKRQKVKAIFQGGEKAEVGTSFVSQCNYGNCWGAEFIRVVSCNTTGLCRTLQAVDSEFGIKQAHATLIRRASDPWDIYHGPVNALVPHLVVPSHHGPDVQTILPHVQLFTTSVSVPTTLMHMHSISVDLDTPAASTDEVADVFKDTARVRMVYNSDGIRSTAEILEYAKDLGRHRGDMPEVCVWKETMGIQKNKLFYLQAIHQESDVVPESIDAIRAACRMCSSTESMRRTNESLNI